MQQQGHHKQKEPHSRLRWKRRKTETRERPARCCWSTNTPPRRHVGPWRRCCCTLWKRRLRICALAGLLVSSLLLLEGSGQKHTTAGCKHSASWRADVRRNTRTASVRGGWPTLLRSAAEYLSSGDDCVTPEQGILTSHGVIFTTWPQPIRAASFIASGLIE